MSLLLLFAFLSGLVTTLTPCVLPILPVVLATSVLGGVRRPLGVVVGLVFSFTFFTLFLTSLISFLGLPDDLMRNVAVFVLFVFGLVMVVPALSEGFGKLSSPLAQSPVLAKVSAGKSGFWGGLLIGCVLGLLWTPCAGPILASVIVLAATRTVTFEVILITFAYACGTAVVLLFVMYGGRGVVGRIRRIVGESFRLSQEFGVLMIGMALVVFMQWDRAFQAYIVKALPSWALTPLAVFESDARVTRALGGLGGNYDSGKARGEIENGLDKARLLGDFGEAPELIVGGAWLNTEKPLSVEELRGNVFLVDFWTYSCVNCIRTLPYLKEWQERYSNKGFIVIGVHTPEFAFEKVESSVEKAISDFGLNYPVMMDNDYVTWRAYRNRYWPAKYLVDAQGVIRYRHFGEGNYDQTERAIQLLLEEVGKRADYEIAREELVSYMVKTPETYMGYGRLDNRRLKVDGGIAEDVYRAYTLPSDLGRDEFGLGGEWLLSREYAQARKGAVLRMKFYSREANLVMGVAENMQDLIVRNQSVGGDSVAVSDSTLPKGTNFCTNEVCVGGGDGSAEGIPVRVRYYDSRMVNTNSDLDEGIVYVNRSKLYRLVELSQEKEGIVELEFLGDGVMVYSWTF